MTKETVRVIVLRGTIRRKIPDKFSAGIAKSLAIVHMHVKTGQGYRIMHLQYYQKEQA